MKPPGPPKNGSGRIEEQMVITDLGEVSVNGQPSGWADIDPTPGFARSPWMWTIQINGSGTSVLVDVEGSLDTVNWGVLRSLPATSTLGTVVQRTDLVRYVRIVLKGGTNAIVSAKVAF